MSLGLLWSRAIARPVVTFAKRRPLGAVGALILLIMILVAVTAPLIAPFDPRSVHVRNKFADPGDVVEKTGERLWLGSDQLGRDTLSRLIYGTRISLYVSLISVSIGVTLGALLGIISAYFGGVVDLLLQRIVDALMAFPGLVLAMAVVAVAGASLQNVVLALVAIFLPGAARVVRSQALAIKETDYMLAGRASGATNLRLIFRHMLPNCMAPYLVFATANLGWAVVIEAGLSFLGLGTPPEVPSWGGTLSYAGQRYIEVSPWLVLFPSIAVSLAVFGFNLLGDALRDVLDPRLRGA